MSTTTRHTIQQLPDAADWTSRAAAVNLLSPLPFSFDDVHWPVLPPHPPLPSSPPAAWFHCPPSPVPGELLALPSPVSSLSSTASSASSPQSPLSVSSGPPRTPFASPLPPSPRSDPPRDVSAATVPWVCEPEAEPEAEGEAEAAATDGVKGAAVLAAVVPEDPSVVERLRHRAIDNKRRQREAKVMSRLAALLHLPAPRPSNPSNKRRRTPSGASPSPSSSSSPKAPDRVALLEAVSARLEALERGAQAGALRSAQRLGDPHLAVGCVGDPYRVTLAAMTADTGDKVAFDSVYSGIPQRQQFRSRTWFLVITQLEDAYRRGDVNPDFGIDFGPASYWPDIAPARTDPRGSAYMRALYALLRGEVSSVNVDFATYGPGAWVDTKAVAWTVPHSGARHADRPLSSGKLLVFASRQTQDGVPRSFIPAPQRPLTPPGWWERNQTPGSLAQ